MDKLNVSSAPPKLKEKMLCETYESEQEAYRKEYSSTFFNKCIIAFESKSENVE